MADSGLFAGTMIGDSIAIDQKVAQWGRGEGEVLSVDAVTETKDGGVVAFDRQLHRITWWGRSGGLVRALTVPRTALADDYVAGDGAVIAVTSHSGDQPYASTIGELRSLDSLGYAITVVASFPSQVLHLTNGPRGSKFLHRPLEHQPIVHWSDIHGWIIASTDSLNIHFGPAREARVIAGSGARARIDPATRDSSIDAFVRSTGAKGSGANEARSFATETFFRDRTHLQLIDDVVPLLDGRIAVRRMRLCRDRHGWNVIDSTGHGAGAFAVPLAYRSVMSVNGGVLFAMPRGDSTSLIIVPVSPPVVQIVNTSSGR